MGSRGWRSAWHRASAASEAPDAHPLWLMLQALQEVLTRGTVVAVAADKSQAIAHDAYERVQRIRVGKRQVVIMRPAG